MNKNKDDCVQDIKEEISLRQVKKKDCHDLWKWRNHPEVKKWCLNKQNIKLEDHKNWFEKKTSDKNIRIYIAENKTKEKIGQVRLEKIKKESFEINLNLNPRFFGQGHGNKIIRKATMLLMKDNPEVKEVIAEILHENIVSQKAFQKAGYFFSHKIFKDKQSLIIFKFER